MHETNIKLNEAQNNLWTTVATIRWDWVPTAPTDLTTKDYVDNNSGGGSTYAFWARMLSTQNITTTYTTLQFNQEIYDLDWRYNSWTYTFQAPVTGIYQFTVWLNLSSAASWDILAIRLLNNGVTELREFRHNWFNTSTMWGTTQVELNAWNQVVAQMINFSDNDWTTSRLAETEFSWHLIQAT